ncbi:MAG: DUF6600 domain-containing protein [bacterium]
MRAPRFRTSFLTALASLFALALACPPASRAQDDGNYGDGDGWYGDDSDSSGYDDNGGYDDEYGNYGDDSYDNYDDYGVSGAIPHYGMLDDYGAWRYVPAFGTNLWFPWVDDSWRPYYYGHWVRSSFGMMWVSHEPWGAIPYHYGHWVFVRPFGWGWVPGWEWAPAWVTWAVTDGYVGWAPCPPPGYHYPHSRRYRSSVYVSWYGHRGGYDYDDYGMAFSFWIFLGNRNFCGEPVWQHALAEPTALSLWKTKRIQPVGPRLDVAPMEKVARARIPAVRLDHTRQIVDGRSLDLYSPRGQKEYIREGRQAAERSYVKPARFERAQRSSPVEKHRAERPQGVKGYANPERRGEPDARVENGRQRREAPGRSEEVQKRDAPQRSERVQQREAPQRSERVQQREAPQRSEKVQQREEPSRSPKVRKESTSKSDRRGRS